MPLDWRDLLRDWETEHPPKRRCDWVCDHFGREGMTPQRSHPATLAQRLWVSNSARFKALKCLNCDNDIPPGRSVYCSTRCGKAVKQRVYRARRRAA